MCHGVANELGRSPHLVDKPERSLIRDGKALQFPVPLTNHVALGHKGTTEIALDDANLIGVDAHQDRVVARDVVGAIVGVLPAQGALRGNRRDGNATGAQRGRRQSGRLADAKLCIEVPDEIDPMFRGLSVVPRHPLIGSDIG